MKKLLTLFLIFTAFISNAQRTMFGRNNNYVRPVIHFVAPAIVTNGLVLNLDAANPASYNGSGTTWTNLVTGNAVSSFTLNGSVTYNSANGGILRFADGGLASTSNSLGRFTKYSIETWVKIAGTSGAYPCLFTESVNAGVGGANMILGYNTGFGATNQYTSGFNSSSWNVYTTTTNTSDVNNWVQIVATYDGNICTIYKNGVSIGSGSIGSSGINSANLGYNIGKRWDQSNFAYGDYAVVKLYNRDLTSSEVATNFNALKSRFGFSVITDQLAMYLDAANPASYSANGTIWTDLSGNNNHITLAGGYTYNQFGAITFNGTSGWGYNNGDILSKTSYTKQVWIKFNSFSFPNNIVSGKTGEHAFWLYSSNPGNLQAGHNYVWSRIIDNTALSTGVWYNVAVTFNNSTGWVLYINGQQKSTSSDVTTFIGTGDIQLASFKGAANFLNGDIAHTLVYNRSLTASEILENFNALKSRFGLQ